MKKNIALITLIFMLLPLSAGFAAPFYQGKTMKLIVATKPGGGYDFYARLVAQYMQKYLSGVKTIIVKNVPGAGHIIGTNTIYKSKPDGLTFGTFNRALGLTQVAGLKGVKFDLAKMGWLGSAAIEPMTFVVGSNSGIKNIDDVLKVKKIRIASPGVGTEGHVTPMLFAEMMGLKNFSFSSGFLGGEAELAMMRGEVDAQFASLGSISGFMEQGHGIPVMFTAQKPVPGYENVPLIQNVVKDKSYQPVIDLLFTVSLLGRPFAAPPGIPAERLKILQEAFYKAMHDNEAIKISQKAGRPLDYVSGEDAQKMAKSILEVSPQVVKLVKEAYGVK